MAHHRGAVHKVVNNYNCVGRLHTAQCVSLPILSFLPYSEKFSRGPIFADWSLGKFSWFNFRGLSSPKAHPYRHVKKFMGLTSVDSPQSAKTAKINTLENFLLYGISYAFGI